MAFCTACGNMLIDGDCFCTRCGTQVRSSVQASTDNPSLSTEPSIIATPSNEVAYPENPASDASNPPIETAPVSPRSTVPPPENREQLIAETIRLRDYFALLFDIYQQRSVAKAQLEECSDVRFLPAFLALFIGIPLILFGLLVLSFYMELPPTELLNDLLLLLLENWLIYLVVCAAIAFGLHRFSVTNREEEEESLIQTIASANNKLTNHYNAAENCFISYEYSDPRTIDALLKLLLSNRCSTYQDAVNLMLEESHRSKMHSEAVRANELAEEQQKQQRSQSLLQTFMLFGIYNNTKD